MGAYVNQFKIHLDHLKFKLSVPKAFESDLWRCNSRSNLNLKKFDYLAHDSLK
jgi:hypothetical protein